MKCGIAVRPVLIHRWIKSPGNSLAHRLKKLNVRFWHKADIEAACQPSEF
jgi:hypothetical protein